MEGIQHLDNLPYEPFTTAADEIRLIKLRPESPAALDVCCELLNVVRYGCAPFTAVSYAWGRNQERAPLMIGGQRYWVNKPVEAVLRHLQTEQSEKLVWIDQVCINQRDDVEKSAQVQQMRQIYSEAQLTVVWLGEARDKSDLLLRHLARIGEWIWAAEDDRVLALHSRECVLDAIELAFHAISAREYWKRLWVMQEFAVAARLRIACGSVQISDWHLSAVLVFAGQLPQRRFSDSAARALAERVSKAYQAPATSFMEGLVTRRMQYWDERQHWDSDPLFHVLAGSLALEHDYNQPLASDSRDRVLALVHLATDADEFLPVIDYTWACERVYTETARTILMQGHIDLLSYCQFPKRLAGLPTWVPDWTMQIRSPVCGPPWKSSFCTWSDVLPRGTASSSSPSVLKIQGIIIDTVQECGTCWDPNWLESLDIKGALAYLQQIRQLCTQSQRLRNEDMAEGAAAFIAIAYPYQKGMRTADYAMTFTDVIAYLRGLLAFSLPGKSSTIDDISNSRLEEEARLGPELYAARLRLLHSRAPLLSKSGYVGIGPGCAQAGDCIAILVGGKIPYILRPNPMTSSTENMTYSVVGEAYVFSIMKGELRRSSRNASFISLV